MLSLSGMLFFWVQSVNLCSGSCSLLSPLSVHSVWVTVGPFAEILSVSGCSWNSCWMVGWAWCLHSVQAFVFSEFCSPCLPSGDTSSAVFMFPLAVCSSIGLFVVYPCLLCEGGRWNCFDDWCVCFSFFWDCPAPCFILFLSWFTLKRNCIDVFFLSLFQDGKCWQCDLKGFIMLLLLSMACYLNGNAFWQRIFHGLSVLVLDLKFVWYMFVLCIFLLELICILSIVGIVKGLSSRSRFLDIFLLFLFVRSLWLFWYF